MTKEIIIERSIPEPNSGCWLWARGVNKTGYGQIKHNRVQHGAHRVSYLVFKGDPSGFFVCHKCDTPACVNPDHLWLGDATDNNRDTIKKKRQPSQLRTHCPKGHPYSGENLIIRKGSRICKTCSYRSTAFLHRKAYWKLRGIDITK